MCRVCVLCVVSLESVNDGAGGRGRQRPYRGGESGGDELEEGHLRGGVLHGHTVGLELEVRLAPLDVGARCRILQMPVDDFL